MGTCETAARLVMHLIVTAVDAIPLQRREEALTDGVALALAIVAHARHLYSVGQQLAVGQGGVLNATIGVDDQRSLQLSRL